MYWLYRSLALGVIAGLPLAAGTITFSVSGVTGASFSDVGYFGGGTFGAGTSFSLDFTYDPSGCTFRPLTQSELLDACNTNDITADFTLGSTTLTTGNAGAFGSLIEQSVNGGKDYFQYIDPGPTLSLQYFLFSTNSYQDGVIANQPISNIDASASNQAYICNGILTSCDVISLSVQSESAPGAPEPGSVALLGAAAIFASIRKLIRP